MSSIAVDLYGCEIRYRGNKYKTRTIEYGKGEPLILIHGIGGHAEAYARNIKRLGEKYHVIAIDLLWHGGSSKPPVPKDTMITTYADQVLDLADSLGYERISIEGESLGGWIAIWMALHHPERLNKIILNTNAGIRFREDEVKVDAVGGTQALRDRSLAALRNPAPETIRKRLEWLVASPDRVTDELVALRLKIYSTPETQASLISVFENNFVEPRPQYIDESELSKITTPKLILWADKNPGVGEDGGRRTAKLIQGSTYYCISDAGHWPQWEKPEEHDQVVLEFLGK